MAKQTTTESAAFSLTVMAKTVVMSMIIETLDDILKRLRVEVLSKLGDGPIAVSHVTNGQPRVREIRNLPAPMRAKPAAKGKATPKQPPVNPALHRAYVALVMRASISDKQEAKKLYRGKGVDAAIAYLKALPKR